MAFDYQLLKKITNASIVDSGVQNADFDDLSITTDKIADGDIGSAKLGTGSVQLNATTVTGTLPISKGGTGRTTIGSAYQLAIRDSGGNISFANSGLASMNVYRSNGTWSKPSGVRYIKVCVVGSGGGGSGHGESGGAGGYAEEIIDVTSVNSVTVTIGGAAGGTYYSGRGGNGGASSFGSYVSAGGGYGANRNNQHSGGLGGVGSGGNLNIYGGGGQPHHTRSSPGGPGFWGGPTAAGHPQGGQFTYNHRNHAAPGSGGSGGYFYGNRGANTVTGMVVVYNYY